MNVLLVILLATGLIALALLGLAIQVIFTKKHKFPNMHVGGNKNLARHGITCAQSWDKMEQRKGRQIKVEGLKLGKR
jgi:hypothetical protein